MYFDSFSAAIAMDGHGGFVWAAYAVTAVVLVLLVTVPMRRRRRQVLELVDGFRRDQALGQKESA